MSCRSVTVFGGTGFLGQRIVRQLLAEGVKVRAAVRRPERAGKLFPADPLCEAVAADINDEASIVAALTGAEGAVNAVSLYVERAGLTFHSVHVTAAERLARLAEQAGVARLVHLSGIGADAHSSSPYIRSRGEGEKRVRAAFPRATVIRPAAMFGVGDSLVTPLAGLLCRLPVFALFGCGRTRLQPVFVEDVAAAVARLLGGPPPEPCYELAGPEIMTYRQLVCLLARHLGRRPLLLPLPFWAWQGLAALAELLPRPPITRNQVALMRHDNVASRRLPGFPALQIAPRALRERLPLLLKEQRLS